MVVQQCPVCDSSKNKFLAQYKNKYKLYSCTECDLYFYIPRDYTREQYEQDYFRTDTPFDYSIWLANLKEIHSSKKGEEKYCNYSYLKEIVKLVPKIIPSGSTILDIGCGSGFTLKKLKEKGYKIYGIEIVEQLVKGLLSLGYDVYNGDFSDYPKTWNMPHLVIASEVLEHLDEPLQFLKAVKEKFSSAILLVTVPSPNRVSRFKKIDDPCDYPPYHFTRWSKRSLEYALKKAGYREIEIKEYPVPASETPYPAYPAIISFLGRAVLRPLRKHSKEPETTPVAIFVSRALLSRVFAFYYTLLGAKGWSMIATAKP